MTFSRLLHDQFLAGSTVAVVLACLLACRGAFIAKTLVRYSGAIDWKGCLRDRERDIYILCVV